MIGVLTVKKTRGRVQRCHCISTMAGSLPWYLWQGARSCGTLYNFLRRGTSTPPRFCWNPI